MGSQVISRIEVCQRSPESDLLQSPFPGRIHKLLPHFKDGEERLDSEYLF